MKATQTSWKHKNSSKRLHERQLISKRDFIVTKKFY